MAIKDSGISKEEIDPHGTGLILGSAGAAMEQQEHQLYERGVDLTDYSVTPPEPLVLFRSLLSAPVSAIARDLDIQGYCAMESATCPSALYALSNAALRIGVGYEDLIVAGGVDAPINRSYLAALCSAKAVSIENEIPAIALRPFDKFRTRSLLGEGAAIFIVESEARARSRGARIYCNLPQQNAFQQENRNDLYLMDKTGEKWATLIKRSLRSVGLNKIDCIFAHAPSDKDIDLIESRALHTALGKSLRKTSVTSIKGSVGSGFAAAGAFQFAAAIKSLQHGIVPPTLNFHFEDKECSIDPAHKKINRKINNVLVMAHGQGGNNACMVINKEGL